MPAAIPDAVKFMVAIFMAAFLIPLLVWLIHSQIKSFVSPLRPARRGLRPTRALSASESAIAAYGNPRAVLGVMVLELLVQAKARVRSLSPLLLERLDASGLGPQHQRLLELLETDSAGREGQLLDLLEDFCRAVEEKVAGHSVALTLVALEMRARSEFKRALNAGRMGVQAGDSIPWIFSREKWVRELHRIQNEGRALPGAGTLWLEEAMPSKLRGLMDTFAACEDIREHIVGIESILDYAESHPDAHYLNPNASAVVFKVSMVGSCANHSTRPSEHFCTSCHKEFCDLCFDPRHRRCWRCAFPYVTMRMDSAIRLDESYAERERLPDVARILSPSLVIEGFYPTEGTHIPVYQRLNEAFPFSFVRDTETTLEIVSLEPVDRWDAEAIRSRCVELNEVLKECALVYWVHDVRKTPPAAILLAGLTQCRAQYVTEARRMGISQSFSTAPLPSSTFVWIADLVEARIHASTYLDAEAETPSTQLVTALTKRLQRAKVVRM